MNNNDVKLLEAMMVILAKRIHALERKVNGGGKIQSDKMWLEELRKEALRIMDRLL